MGSQRLVLITRCLLVAIIHTCKSVSAEATAYISKLVDHFINSASPSVISADETACSYFKVWKAVDEDYVALLVSDMHILNA